MAAGGNLGTGGLVFDGAGAGVLDITGTTPFNSAMAVTLTSSGTIRQDDTAAATLSGPIGGGGSLLKTGAGKLVLSGSDSYTGGTFVTAGTLIVTTASGLANGSSLTVGNFPAYVHSSAPDDGYMAPAGDAASGAAAPVPEPGTLALLGVAGIILAAAAWRKRTA